MRTLSDFQHNIFVIQNNTIHQMTYEEYLNEYWSDETTSPRGVENRQQIAAVLFDENNDVLTYSLNNRDNLTPNDNETLKFALYNWGPSGNRGQLIYEFFDTEEEAYIKLLEGKEYDYHNKSTNIPTAYESFEEAEEIRIESEAYNMGVDTDVYVSIERKQRLIDSIKLQKIEEYNKKYKEKQEIIFNQYKDVIIPIKDENYKETANRLSIILPNRIDGSTFHRLVKFIRNH